MGVELKPLKLKLKNIGPFLDETVDFSQLSDMFLVRGKTGSGKTTIFDAMTYALYGEVTGIRQTKSVKLHSDYVPAEESGLVVFEFLLNHQVYRISRTAKADTLSKTGKLRRAVNQMTLEKKDDDDWTVLDGTPTELTQKVRDLIGLSREEFSQIVLLPQGEFAAFLRQDPSERKQTLSKLFPVEFYSSLCDFVKQKASVAEQKMSVLSASLESETENFDRERAVSESLSIKNEIDSLKTANDELALSIQMVSAEKEKLNLELNSALEAEKLTAQIKNLELQKEKIKSDRNKIYLSETAAAVKNAVLQRDRAEVKLLDTQNNIASSKKVLSDLQKKYDELDGQKKEFSDVSLKIEKLSLSVNDEIKKLEQSEKIEQAKKKLTEAKSKLCEYFSKIVPALSLCEKQLGENKLTVTGISDSLETAENAKKALEAAQNDERINHSASALSKELKEGSPCPVCGSTHHPAPAVLIESGKDFASLLKVQEDAVAMYRAKLEKLEKDARDILSKKTLFESFKSQIQSAAQSYGVCLPAEDSLPERTDPLPNGTFIPSMQDKINSAVNNLSCNFAAANTVDVASFTSAQDIVSKINALNEEKEQLKDRLSDYEKSCNDTRSKLDSVKSRIDTLGETEKEFLSEHNEAVQNVRTELSKTNFTDEQSALAAVLSDDDYNLLKKNCDSFEKEYDLTKAKLESIKCSGLSASELSQKYSESENKLNGLTEKNNKNSDSITSLTSRKSLVDDKLRRIENLEAQIQELSEKNSSLLKLSLDLGIKNPKKIPFDSWVLGTFFEDVVSAANLRFRKISSGRFEFILKEDSLGGRGAKGLDLAVGDSYTGHERSTASLSGGETFMASLSLALALTDIVQSRTGGIRLDSLFIDEGFGSLDGETLDNAISILDEVREERMVGIISHVDSLAQSVPCHIDVEKSNCGSRIHVSA